MDFLITLVYKKYYHLLYKDFGSNDYDEQEIQRVVNWCTHGLTAHIERVKSEYKTMTYVTKEDSEAIFKGINTNVASMFLKMTEFIKTNEIFTNFHPFIAARPNYYRYIRAVRNYLI